MTPGADAYVDASSPSGNYGKQNELLAQGTPDVHSYLRFSVAGPNGASISRVTLRLHVNTTSLTGLTIVQVDDTTWDETTLTYENAPPLGSTIAQSDALVAGTWVSLDVTPYIGADGTYSIGIKTSGITAISMDARESGGNAPQLIIEYAP